MDQRPQSCTMPPRVRNPVEHREPAVNSPFFSVIIPTFNRADYVVNAIGSVLDQTFKDFELIVVDDGSTDQTAEALLRFLPKLNVIRQRNSGVSAARNRGADHARGRWLAFLDSDDQWHPTYLQTQREHLGSAEPVVLQCMDCVVHCEEQAVRRYFQLNGADSMFGTDECLLLPRPCSFVLEHSPWQVGSTVVEVQAFRLCGGFNERLQISEDMELLARISLLGAGRFVNLARVDILRRREATESLSVVADRQPLRKRAAHDAIYATLNALPELSRQERRSVRHLRGANQRAVGNLLLQTGHRSEALRAFWRAFWMAPSMKSFSKLCLSFLPWRARQPA